MSKISRRHPVATPPPPKDVKPSSEPKSTPAKVDTFDRGPVLPPAAPPDPFKPPANLTALTGDRGFVGVLQPSQQELASATSVRFSQNRGAPSVELRAGGRMLITYDPARTQLFGSANGLPAYGVTAYVRLEPSGQVMEKPAVAFEQTSSRVLGMPYAAPVLVDLPQGTTGVSVWFRQFSAGDRPPAEAWDSNYGQNYHFNVS